MKLRIVKKSDGWYYVQHKWLWLWLDIEDRINTWRYALFQTQKEAEEFAENFKKSDKEEVVKVYDD